MKKYLMLASVAMAVVTMVACAGKDNPNELDSGKMTLTGEVKGMKEGFLEIASLASDSVVVDSIEVKDGKFSYSTELKEPLPYVLRVANAMSQPLFFFADPGKVTINGPSDSLHTAKIEGGNSQALFSQLNDKLMESRKGEESMRQEFMMAQSTGDTVKMKEVEAKFIEGNEKLVAFAKDLAIANPANVVSAFIAANFLMDPAKIEDLKTVFEKLSPAVKSSYYGDRVDKVIKAAAATAVGSVAPDFSQPGVDGNPLQLSSLRGKVVLVDFWASWCGPCRAENPNVVKAYNKYKEKGFEILGVSLDENAEAWKKAIADDKLVWQQVGDMKGWRNDAAQLYGINSIPASFLLDKEGKIIARDLRGEDLDKKLAEVLN